MGKITAIQIEDQISRHPELMSVLNGHQEYNGQPISMEDRQRVAGDLAIICKNSGLEVNDVFFFGDSGTGMFGFYDPEGKVVAINLFEQGGNNMRAGDALTNTMHHEMAHAQTQRRDEGYSNYMGSHGESTRGLVNWLSGNGYADSTTGWYEWKYDRGNASAVNASLTRVESFDLDKVHKSGMDPIVFPHPVWEVENHPIDIFPGFVHGGAETVGGLGKYALGTIESIVPGVHSEYSEHTY